MKNMRKFLAMVLSLLMMMALATTAFATETTANRQSAPMAKLSVTDDGIITAQPRSGNIVATGNNNFYGDGTLDIYLASKKTWAYIQAGTGGSSASGAVNVSVKFPDGNWYNLGQIYASGGHTLMKQFSTCPSGTYHFVFENSTTDWIQVYANIYD